MTSIQVCSSDYVNGPSPIFQKLKEELMFDWFKTTIDSITSIVKDPIVEWQKRKTLQVEQIDKEKERDHELKLEQLKINAKLAEQGIQAETNWDDKAQENMQHSWKDEYLLILFSIPLIGCFIPSYQEDVLRGFEILQKTPQWYIWSVLGMVAGAWGLRWLISGFRGLKNGS